MEFGVLGPLVVRDDGGELALGGPKQRALLAMLLLRPNVVLSRDELIDGLWGERPPPTADHTLDNYVSRLRKLLGADRVVRRSPGYLLKVEPGELDAARFEELFERGRSADDARAAAEALRTALALWRGPALADMGHARFAQGEAERLEALRLLAREECFEADLALGGGALLVPELEAFVAEHPFRERALGQLMLALYRAGRQADALAAFQDGRERLVEELGLEPGPELHELQARILAQDPTLSPQRVRRLPSPRGSQRLAAVVAAAALLSVTAIAVALSRGGPDASSDTVAVDHLVRLGGRGGERTVALPGAPSAMAVGYGSLWVAAPGAGSVSRVDLAKSGIADSVPVGGSPALLAVGGGSVWIASALGDRVRRVDPASGAIVQSVGLNGARAAALAFGAGRLWIADSVESSLIAVGPASGRIERTLPLSLRPSTLAVGGGTMWVADYGGGSLAEVDLSTGRTLATVHVGGGPTAIAVAGGAVWVANALDSTVAKVDARSGSVAAVIPVASGPAGLALAGPSLWVTSQYAGSVSRIDLERAVVTGTFRVGGGPAVLAVARGKVWVGVRPPAVHRGGTLRLMHTRPLNIDPAVNADFLPLASDSLVRDGLVGVAHVAGSGGTELVPDLAVALPAPTAGGTTYTFRLRRGIRYSDGRALSAHELRRAVERVFRVGSWAAPAFEGVVGAAACTRARCDLSAGIVADEATHTITFHLREPDPDFPAALALAPAAAVPPGTPMHDAGLRPIPGTGPYKIAAASTSEIRYERNPFFREWSHAAQPDGNPAAIVVRLGVSLEAQVRAVEQGHADAMVDGLPPTRLPELRTRYASRLHAATIPTTAFIQFNTTLAPFDDVRARRALNLALDRRAIARLYGGLATPTCQVLPPGVPGYRPYCPHTRNPGRRWSAPDVARARRLVAESGTRSRRVTLWSWTDDGPELPRYYVSVLRRLGYRARFKLVSHAALEAAPKRVYRRIQLIPASWGDTPQGFFGTWFACDGRNVHGWFCDRRLDRQMARAQQLKATQPRAASALWARIDRALVDQAAWAPTVELHGLDFVSARVRNYQFHPYGGLIADQLWLDPQQPTH